MIVAMAVSGCVFIIVSLATQPSERIRLVPFFPDESLALAASLKGGLHLPIPEGSGVMDRIDVRCCGKTVRLHFSAELLGNVDWKQLIARLSGAGENWVCMAGAESIQRFGHGGYGEFLSCVTVTWGDSLSMLWFEAEGSAVHLEQLKQDVCRAFIDTEAVLELCRKQQPEQPVVARFLRVANNPR